MAISYVGKGTYAADSAATVTPTLPADTQANDILVIVCGCNGDQTLAASGYTKKAEYTAGASATLTTVALFWKRHDGSESDPSVTGASDAIIAQVVAFRGVDTGADPWDAYDAGASSGTDASAELPSLTTITDGAYVIGAVATAASNAWGGASSPKNIDPPRAVTALSTLLGADASLLWIYGAMDVAGAIGDPYFTQSTLAPQQWVATVGALKPASVTADFNLNLAVQVADEVWETPTAHLTSLSTTSGIPGASLTITGTDLGTGGVVEFDNTTAVTSSWTATAIACTVPNVFPGNYAVTVTPTGGDASNSITYTVTAAPVSAEPTLFDGELYVSVGGVDVTAELLPGLRLSSTSPGGWGECSMRLDASEPFQPFYASVVRGAVVVVIHNGTVLFYGEVVNDSSAATVSGGEIYYDIAAGGLYNKAGTRQDFSWVWQDSDNAQWFAKKTASKGAEMTNDEGVLSTAFLKGRDVTSGRGAGWYYWMNGGLGADANFIDHLTMTLADYEGTGYGMDLGSHWEVRFQTSTHPWGSWSESRYFTAAGYGGPLAAGAALRIPASGSMPVGTMAVRMLFIPTSTTTTTADRFVAAESVTVFGQADEGLRVDEVMCDIATADGLAISTTSSAVGFNLTGDIVVRPHTSRAGALEEIVALADDATDWGFWNGPSFEIADRVVPADATYTVDVTDPGIDYDVHAADEGVPDYVRVLYASSGHATYPDGTVLQQTATATGAPPIDWSDAAKRVSVLDLSETRMGATQAAAIGAEYLTWCGRNAYRGSIVIRTPEVDVVAGGKKLAAYIRAGEWIEEASHGATTGPLYISVCDIDVDAQSSATTVTLTIGESEDEFKARIYRRRTNYDRSTPPTPALPGGSWPHGA